MLKQKIIGAVLIIVSVVSAILLDGDITAAILMVPMGIYLIFSKTNWIYYSKENEEES